MKKVNTVPRGAAIIIILISIASLSAFLGIIILPKIEAIGLFGFALAFLLVILYYLSQKHWNLICYDERHIWYRERKYSWDGVYITASCLRPTFARNSYDYYLFFDDHYLTKEECTHKSVRNNGFCIILNVKRMEMLKHYNKKIKLANVSPYGRTNKIVDLIELHNLQKGD